MMNRTAASYLVLLLVLLVETTSGSSEALCLASSDPSQVLLMLRAAHNVTSITSGNRFWDISVVRLDDIPINSLTYGQRLRNANCTVVVGPGYPRTEGSPAPQLHSVQRARALSIASSTPVIDYGTVAQEMSDTNEHPYYTRTAFADLSPIIERIMQQFGWTRCSLVKVNIGVNIQLDPAVGAVVRSLAMVSGEPPATPELSAFMTAAAKDDTMIPVFVVGSESESASTTVAGVAAQNGVHLKRVLIFIEFNSCPPLPTGSLCVQLTVGDAQESLLGIPASYLRPGTDAAAESTFRAAFPDVPFPVDISDDIGSGYAAAAAVDAVLIASKKINARTTWRVDAAADAAEIRKGNYIGATGQIDIDSDGERRSAQVLILNSASWNDQKEVGTMMFYQNGTVRSSFSGSITWPRGITDRVPKPGDPQPETISGQALMLVGIAVVVAGVCAVWAIARVHLTRRRRSMAMQKNTLPRVGRAVFLFARISNFKALSRVAPLDATIVSDVFHQRAASLATHHHLCLVKFVESQLLLIAGTDAKSCLQYASRLHGDLQKYDWARECPKLSAFYVESEERARSSNCGAVATESCTKDLKAFNGPRIKIGLAHGTFHEIRDAAGRVDYIGDALNCAARVMAAAGNGQTLSTASVLSTMPPSQLKLFAAHAVELDSYHLSGFRDPITIFEHKPDIPVPRNFSPLASGYGFVKLEDLDESGSQMAMSSGSADGGKLTVPQPSSDPSFFTVAPGHM